MSRPGINYDDVANAAHQLKKHNRNPTIESVRALLKTGSSSTINTHLRKWKNLQNSAVPIAIKEKLPEELVLLMKNLWEHLVSQAEERVRLLEQDHQKTLADVKEELEKYKTNNQRWQQLYPQWIKEKSELLDEKKALEEMATILKKDFSLLSSKQEILRQQHVEKQERIQELHQLHKQAQTNVEHYREAMREQRLLDQEQFEQQKQELQISLKTMQEKIIGESKKNIALEQQYELLQQSYNELEKRRAEELITSEQKYNHQTKKLIELEVKSKLLSQKLAASQQTLGGAQENIKLLTHEKSQLEEQLKLMQATVVQQVYKFSKKIEEF
jgi:hypothetical protein